MTVVPFVREPGSSARTTVENGVFKAKPTYRSSVLEIHGGDQMRQAIAAYRGSIGMIGVSSDDPKAEGLHLVSIDGVAPTKAALVGGSHTLRRPLYLLIDRDTTTKPAVASFLEFVKSREGQKILQKF